MLWLRLVHTDPGDVQDLELFTAAKAKLDAAGTAGTAQQLMDVMHSLTTVRALLLRPLSSGLR